MQPGELNPNAHAVVYPADCSRSKEAHLGELNVHEETQKIQDVRFINRS